MRTSYGYINANGDIVNPGTSDWASIPGKNENKGAYTIEFNPPFKTEPIVVVSGGDSTNIITVVEMSTNSFKVESRGVKRPEPTKIPPLEPGPVSFIAMSVS